MAYNNAPETNDDTVGSEQSGTTEPCPAMFPEEDKKVTHGWSGTIKGGVIVECGLITHVPEGWPLSCFPKYKAPCTRCGEDCGGGCDDDGSDGGDGGGDNSGDDAISCPEGQTIECNTQREFNYMSAAVTSMEGDVTITHSDLQDFMNFTQSQSLSLIHI